MLPAACGLVLTVPLVMRGSANQGMVTSCRTTGPVVGSSSVAWEAPGGVSRSITFGTVEGSTEQMGLVPPGAQTPKVYPLGVVVKALAWSGLKPSWPVRTTVKPHPLAGVPPSAVLSTVKVVYLVIELAETLTVPVLVPVVFGHRNLPPR